MRFTVEQRFRTGAEETARAFADPDLYAGFAALPKVSVPDVLSCERDGELVHLRIRYRFAGQLSSAARAVIDPDQLTWVDESTHDLARRHVRFVLRPDHHAGRFRCSGDYRIEPLDDGCRRHATIDLKVSAPFVGGAVERAIESGLREHLAEETQVVEAYLADRR
ncbi:MAG TPA: hypothetical protein DCS55_11990 [Acidimicrobiaceae bacterium]|nr:hypothetical protein [Acidimicrobiaceae bacterium]